MENPLARPASAPNPPAKQGELDVFHSRPELHVPVITVGADSSQQSPGDIFVAPYSGVGQDGPMIFESSGNLVWFDPLPANTESTNLQVQSYEGKPVLTWWQGYIPPQGFGQGEEVIESSSYQQIAKFPAGNGLPADLHEFRIMPNNTRAADLVQPDPLQPQLGWRPQQRRGDQQRLSGNRPQDAPGQARMERRSTTSPSPTPTPPRSTPPGNGHLITSTSTRSTRSQTARS